MTQPKTAHSAPRRLFDNYRERVRETERALLEHRTDVVTLIDQALVRPRSVDKGSVISPTIGRDDALGERLRRAVMFADVRQS